MPDGFGMQRLESLSTCFQDGLASQSAVIVGRKLVACCGGLIKKLTGP